MTEAYKNYYNLFSTDDIGQLGIEFFNTIGHLCDPKPKYVEKDPVTLIKEDLNSYIVLDDEMLDDLSFVRQISYVGRVNDSIFERQADDGFISYFAIDVDATFESCASYIKNIQRILMKCANRHTIALYRVENNFILAYGYRNIGKKSNVVYSDWIIDDESAEYVMDNASVWYLSFRSLPRFAFDFQCGIRREKVSKSLSYEAIAYDIFPQYFEEFGFSEENTPKREDRNEFVIWYRNQHREEYDEFDDDSFFLTKDNMLDDDFEIDVDELEMKMLEAEMRGEEIVSSSDEYEEMDLSEFDQAIKIVDGGEDLSDAEDLLKILDEAAIVEEEKSQRNQTKAVSNESILFDVESIAKQLQDFKESTEESKEQVVSGMIEEIILQANPKLPMKLRRTTWKRPDLYFVVEEIRGRYAYGYILDSGVVERRTSYPIDNEKLKWNLQIEQDEEYDDSDEACYKGVNAKVTLLETDYDSEDETMTLKFEIVNHTDSELNLYLVNLCFGDEELDGYHLIGSAGAFETTIEELIIADDMLEMEYLSDVETVAFKIEIDDDNFDELETSEKMLVAIDD